MMTVGGRLIVLKISQSELELTRFWEGLYTTVERREYKF
jgi:hypothetical protein